MGYIQVIWLIKCAKGVSFPNLLHGTLPCMIQTARHLCHGILASSWRESMIPLLSLCGLRSLDPQNFESG